MTLPSRDEAHALLTEHMHDEGLLRHCHAVEAGMTAMARALGQDENLWRITGLLHDIDYQEHPDTHPREGVALLKAQGLPEELVHAVAAHAETLGVAKEVPLDWALSGVDEVTGLIMATALVKPNKILAEVEARSVRKKMKDKAFARAVSREGIIAAAAALGMELEPFIDVVLKGMQEVHETLGM
ncbi:HDIG domain-containing protein [Candidatus Fermentibacteria bacterium]|nr:HDIG domain-containing protein [Candidatus Fermentibacteria bacterium]